MCLMAMVWQPDGASQTSDLPRFPLVLAANRDEFHHRPSTPMSWWSDGQTLAGTDLQAGGTWLGISREGRIGLLTNVREPGRQREGLASRGHLIPLWLDSRRSAHELTGHLDNAEHNGYNLLGLDVVSQQAYCWSNRPGPGANPLQVVKTGAHGLSNAALNTSWPKLERLKASVEQMAQSEEQPQTLLDRLLGALTDRHQPPDEALPTTGISLEWERLLGRIFIETPDGRYGTRCSTALVVERVSPERWRLHVAEQGWDARGRPTERVRHQLEGEFKTAVRPA